eukprot:jgi/Mesvir1/27245/Mv07086-RA.1
MKDNLAQLINRASYETIFTLVGKRLDEDVRTKEKEMNVAERGVRADNRDKKRASGSRAPAEDAKNDSYDHFDVSKIIDAKMVDNVVELLVEWFYTDEERQKANRQGKSLQRFDWLPISNFEPGCNEMIINFCNTFTGTQSAQFAKKFGTNHVAIRTAWMAVMQEKAGQAEGGSEPAYKRTKTEQVSRERTPTTIPSKLGGENPKSAGDGQMFEDPQRAAMAIGMKLKASERKQREIMAELEALRAEKEAWQASPYDASLRGSRVALLKSLGATVQPGADYGIDVHGINVREPWVLAHEGLQCAIKDLTQDYLVVNFKGQVLDISGTDCEFDHTMCYALGKSFVEESVLRVGEEAKKAMKSGPRINCVSNHPLLGASAVAAEDRSCTHGIFDVVEADPPHGATALSVIPDVIKSLSREKLEYWKR